MAPKKSANLPDEVEEIKKSLDFLSAEIKTVAAQQNKIMELMGEIQSLKIQNIEKDKKITFLENRVADLEQYTRMNDLIISGLKTRHRSYARAAAASEDTAAGRGGADAPEVDRESLEQQLCGFTCTHLEAG
ncbi:Ubiquinone/menaquinone biosynthesis C-methyltransferase UbiE [Dissostichus eleginoides]|uniref:Ubiquinone/menaquinone biosynthesis C-methyltransferase UbiE n=1 Tax=Dissostichus eleginoides TaxID=100907 RepID=A0AAD9CPK1_DISEL|nr:Ubiquinone/menaquinone biosynthesis C-methyltransferase UbiE [Dissostichus eleginoides]